LKKTDKRMQFVFAIRKSKVKSQGSRLLGYMKFTDTDKTVLGRLCII